MTLQLDDSELANNPNTRVPICIALDTSGSMAGTKIKELNRGVNIFLESILKQKSKPINKETRENLVMFFKEDVGKLEQLLQINLKHWKE